MCDLDILTWNNTTRYCADCRLVSRWVRGRKYYKKKYANVRKCALKIGG